MKKKSNTVQIQQPCVYLCPECGHKQYFRNVLSTGVNCTTCYFHRDTRMKMTEILGEWKKR